MVASPGPRKLRLALLHVNILLMVGAGALLAGGARLAWDPTAYIALREMWPVEHAVATIAVPAAGVSLLVLTHVAAAAATVETAQRALLITYTCGAVGLCVSTAAWAAWTWARLHSWWVTEGEVATQRGARVAERLLALLESVAELPGGTAAARLLELEREARVVGLRLVRTWSTVGALLVVLQVVALALAAAALLADRKRVQVTRVESPLLSR